MTSPPTNPNANSAAAVVVEARDVEPILSTTQATMKTTVELVAEEEDAFGLSSTSRGRRSRKGARVDYARLAGEASDDDSSDAAAVASAPSMMGATAQDTAGAGANDSATADAPHYANRHVPRVVHDHFDDPTSVLQTVSDGSKLTSRSLKSSVDPLTLSRPILITDKPESIGMRVLKASSKKRKGENGGGNGGGGVTMRDVANIIGEKHAVTVMDVKNQEEMEGWTLGDLVDYFEDEDRLAAVRQQARLEERAKRRRLGLSGSGGNSSDASSDKSSSRPSSPDDEVLSSTSSGRQRSRRAAASSSNRYRRRSAPRVLNQISLEFSDTDLIRHALSPKFVRDLDWIDTAWPSSLKKVGDYPRVQYYCLTSTAGCYTDFHVDFGGTSVWYHVLTGRKVFLLVPPTTANLDLYEKWLCSPDQATTFYPDIDGVAGVYRVALDPGRTLIIPAGYIHAVYTPVDSIVVGGNFLHGLDIPSQLNVHCLETRTRVPAKFRFPHFVRMMFYAGAEYVKRMRSGDVCRAEVEGMGRLVDALRGWSVQPGGDADRVGSVGHAARECSAMVGCGGDEDGAAAPPTALADALEREWRRWTEMEGRGAEGVSGIRSGGGNSGSGRSGGSGGVLKLKLSLKKSGAAGDSPSPRDVTSMAWSRPKLKLKLGMGGNGRGGSPAAVDIEETNGVDKVDEADAEFRITVPSAVGAAMKSKSPKRRPMHADLNPYRAEDGNDADDDEWVPGGKKKKRKGGSGGAATSPAAKKTLNGEKIVLSWNTTSDPPPLAESTSSPRSDVSSQKVTAKKQVQPKARAPAPKNAKGIATARDRLKKKLRF